MLLFLLQGIVKRAWPQEQPHAGLRDMVSSRAGVIPFHKRPHHFGTQLKAFGPIDAATGVRHSRTPAQEIMIGTACTGSIVTQQFQVTGQVHHPI